MTALTIDIPRALWFTSNDLRGSHYKWSPKIKALRALGKRSVPPRSPRLNIVTLTVTVGYPTATRADPPNVAGTVAKALLDGMVDAGLIPDDDSRHIVATTYQRAPGKSAKGTHTMRFEFSEYVEKVA